MKHKAQSDRSACWFGIWRSRQNFLEASAFTLVEVIVAIGVLLILVTLLTQIINVAGNTITGSRKRLDADSTARLVLDRISSDLRQMVRRRDVGYVFYKKTNGNDALFFYGSGPAVSSGSNSNSVALIGYRVTDKNPLSNNVPVMERLSSALAWDGTNPGSMVFLTFSGTAPVAGSTLSSKVSALIGENYDRASSDPDAAHILGGQVFRMEIAFVLKKGTYALSGSTSYSVVATGFYNQPTQSLQLSGSAGNVYGFPPELAGILVTIAVLDETSREILTPDQIANIASQLTDSPSVYPEYPGLCAQKWENKIQELAQGSAIPKAAASQIRVYQRVVNF